MAYLYQAINNVGGLSGSSYDKQKQLYERLGSPQGAYTGSYNQNIWLLGKINSGQTGGGGGQQQQQPQQKAGPSYEDIIRAQEDAARRAAEDRKRQGVEQLDLWNSFMKNPTFFDEILTQKMTQEKWNKYYETLLSDFANPLELKMKQGKEKESQVLDELIRRRAYGEKTQGAELQQNLEAAKEGFAGAGLYGSGGATRALTRQKLTGQESISDFISKSKAEEESQKMATAQQAEELTGQIGLKNKEYFGAGRLASQEVAKDVATQRQEATKRQGLRAYEALTSKYGGDIMLSNLPDFLT